LIFNDSTPELDKDYRNKKDVGLIPDSVVWLSPNGVLECSVQLSHRESWTLFLVDSRCFTGLLHPRIELEAIYPGIVFWTGH
jgi:hypothetical protein